MFRVTQWCPRNGFRRKIEGVIGKSQKLAFFAGLARHASLHADWALKNGQAVGARTGAGGQCADAIEASVGADGPTCINLHTGTGSGFLAGERRGPGCLCNVRLDGQNG